MTAPTLSHVRVVRTSERLVEAADAYDHALADVETGCCAGPHCACDGDRCHFGHRGECVACMTAAVERQEVAADDLARMIVAAGLADRVAEAARAS